MADTPRYVAVRMTRGEETGVGYAFWPYPVEVPPVIKFDGRQLYAYIWERYGWEVNWDGPA